ncbi:MAG: DUF4349 domain-containing protein, partial [Thermoleophilia bacterium]|nr:DUF4349 domain-containing protein [Thermoleophilia bacterium]
QMQGRLRYLANLSALSTVTITVVEVKDYTPPEAPTFATRIRRTFDRSLADLTAFGEGLILSLVAIVPWLPLIAVAAFTLLWGGRRLIRAFRPAVRA